jgi:hypothetical protein
MNPLCGNVNDACSLPRDRDVHTTATGSFDPGDAIAGTITFNVRPVLPCQRERFASNCIFTIFTSRDACTVKDTIDFGANGRRQVGRKCSSEILLWTGETERSRTMYSSVR